MVPGRPRSRRDFEIALICALEVEANALHAIFDRFWDDGAVTYDPIEGDHNAYSVGVIGNHNVVMAYIPGMGKVNAAVVTSGLRSSFPEIKLALLVGICGAVPFPADHSDIYLGDLIISTNIVQYDFGRRNEALFERKDTLDDNLGRPNHKLRSIIAKLRTRHYRDQLQSSLLTVLDEIQHSCPETTFPGVDKDRLYEASHFHVHRVQLNDRVCSECNEATGHACTIAVQTKCDDLGCGISQIVPRFEATSQYLTQPRQPTIHFGKIGSSDTVLRSATQRDLIAKKDAIIAFEMEGAGVWEHLPSLVVKAACDYADTHKTKQWQAYAAAVAAAGTKALLEKWTTERQPLQPKHSLPLQDGGMYGFSTDTLNDVTGDNSKLTELTTKGRQAIRSIQLQYRSCNGDEIVQTFLNELMLFDSLLANVRNNCDHARTYHGTSGAQMRAVSLQIHLEDSIDDILKWHEVGVNFTKSGPQIGSQRHRRDRKLLFRDTNSAEIFQKVLQRMLRLPLDASMASKCAGIKIHFSQQMTNVDVALRLLQRETFPLEADLLDQVKTHLMLGVGQPLADMRYPSKSISVDSERDRSGSSILAFSQSYDERLREIQSMCSDLSDEMQRLTEAFSDSRSHSSRHSGSDAPDTGVQKATKGVVKQRHGKFQSGPEPRSQHLELVNTTEEQVDHYLEPDDSVSVLSNIYSELRLVLDQCFDPIVTDYMRTIQHWQALRQRETLCQFIKARALNDSNILNSLPGEIESCSHTVLSLRQRAFFESLDQEIKEADEILAFSGPHLSQCEHLAERRSRNKGDILKLELSPHHGEASDLAAFLNEWFLKELFANLHLSEFHRQLLAQADAAMSEQQNRHQSRDKWALLDREAWERRVLKSWFSDASLSTTADYDYASSAFTDQTILAPQKSGWPEHGSDRDDGEIVVEDKGEISGGVAIDDSYYNPLSGEDDDQVGARDLAGGHRPGPVDFVRQPVYTRLYLPAGGVQTLIEEPPETVSSNHLHRAQQTLTDYREEVSVLPSHHDDIMSRKISVNFCKCLIAHQHSVSMLHTGIYPIQDDHFDWPGISPFFTHPELRKLPLSIRLERTRENKAAYRAGSYHIPLIL